ncbi:MAG: hypothetical protein IJE08_16070 [Clostridia bacterium]|nr:hypothetical protein [Clostridia bacterium]
MWTDTQTQTILTDDDLLKALAGCGPQIIVIEGPTGCGKTKLLRRLKAVECRSMITLAEDDFMRSLTARLKPASPDIPFDILAAEYEVICIDDIDLLHAYNATQLEAADQFSRACIRSVIILSGIRCCERLRVLLGALTVPYSVFTHSPEQ